MTSAKPKTAFEMILAWSSGRPAWQQDALRRIVASGALGPEDIAELVQLCRKGCGDTSIAVEAKPLTAAHLPASAATAQSIGISSIRNVAAVNRLASGQVLPFALQGITVVYGDNGTGKSGYSRVLKRACRARFPGEILPNAFDPSAEKGATATIDYAVSGVAAQEPAEWSDADGPHPVLSAVSVFDRECGQVHVREKSEVAFRPFGLDIPDELAAASVGVKEALVAEQASLEAGQDAAFATPTFRSDTAAGKILGALTAETDLTPLSALAVLTPEESERLERLQADLAGDAGAAAAEQRLWAASLTRMADDLAGTLAKVSGAVLSNLIEKGQSAKGAREAAKLAAEAAFSGATLQGVGDAAWRSLWDAARRYSTKAAYPGRDFPQTEPDSVCVLCHQTLDEPARARLDGFESFVRADTEQAALAAEEAFEAAFADLTAKPVRIPAGGRHRQLRLTKPLLAREALRVLAAARLRRGQALAASKTGTSVELREMPPSPEVTIRSLAAETLAYADELAQASDPEGRSRLEAERDALRDRAALSGLLPKARAEVARLKALKLVKQCIAETATNAITTLGNNIADEVITPRVRDRFQEEIQKLAASRVRVDIVRSGGKFGSPQYQVRLFANDRAKVGLVLSEGEQTCVGLAVFMTELATSPHRSTLVFDDPVSSLDHRWRHKVAERLVEEAATRQIIVFTHDLVFLNDLHSIAQEKGTAYNALSLIHSADGAGVVTSDLPWVAAKVPERVDTLEKEARAAKLLYEAHDDAGYADAVAKIYSRLRSTWERALEDVALAGVVTRHRDYINTKDLAKVTALLPADVEAFQAAFKRCCDQTDAHDPSRGRNAAPPLPNDVLADIAKVRPWMDAIRNRQKSVA